MQLVTVEAGFAATDLPQALTLLGSCAQEARIMDGCDHYAVFQSPGADGVAIVQRWASMAAFDAYRASPTFAELGKTLGPLMTAPPVTTIAEVAG